MKAIRGLEGFPHFPLLITKRLNFKLLTTPKTAIWTKVAKFGQKKRTYDFLF